MHKYPNVYALYAEKGRYTELGPEPT